MTSLKHYEPTGQIWEECDCGQEPIYMPHYKCLSCWPTRLHLEKAEKTTKKASPKTLENRVIAKNHGGRALRGSTKQKAWGESIRSAMLSNLSKEDSILLSDPNMGVLQQAKFWIENRELSSSDIVSKIRSMTFLVKDYKAENDPIKMDSLLCDWKELALSFKYFPLD